MHSIERYGIVALLFLVVTVVAVLMWDGGKKEREPVSPVAGLTPASGAPAAGRAGPGDAERRLSLAADSQPGPLQRRPRAAERAAAAGQVPGALPLAADAAQPELLEEPEPEPAAAETEPAGVPRLAAAPVAPVEAGRAYTVRSGDTLSEIAQRELGSSRRWPEIVAANPGLDPARLHVGRKLRIPGAGSGTSSASGNPVPATASTAGAEPKAAVREAAAPAKGGKTWKVGPGESLWRIAEKALGDGKRWREIAALNPKVNPDRLSAGTLLVLPDAAKGQSAPARTNQAPKPKRDPSPTVVASSAAPERPRTGGRVR
ncbi:MAG TPA: LysM domain-containing protein [Planctomycetota bacterium]